MFQEDYMVCCERTKHMDLEGMGISLESLRKSRALNSEIRVIGLSPYALKMVRESSARRVYDRGY